MAPFGQAVSEEKIFLTLANQKKELFLAAKWNEMEKLYRGPYIDAYCQVWFHLAKLFQRRRLNQRLSRACIVHLVIQKTNWSYVKTMTCSGSHLGITINIKKTKFVKDLPMIDA